MFGYYTSSLEFGGVIGMRPENYIAQSSSSINNINTVPGGLTEIGLPS